MYRFRATVAITAIAAGATATYTVTEDRKGPAQPGTETKQSDLILVNPTLAAMTANPGMSIDAAWISSPGVIQIKVSNSGGTALTAGNAVFNIAVVR